MNKSKLQAATRWNAQAQCVKFENRPNESKGWQSEEWLPSQEEGEGGDRKEP